MDKDNMYSKLWSTWLSRRQAWSPRRQVEVEAALNPSDPHLPPRAQPLARPRQRTSVRGWPVALGNGA